MAADLSPDDPARAVGGAEASPTAWDALRTCTGVVYPAQCDAMGHMNTPHYIAAFDQAMWHLVHALGYRPAWREQRGEGWADVRYVIDFRSELRAGDLFVVDSAVTRVGRSSLQSRHRLSRVDGRLAAELEMTSVYFDLIRRAGRPLPLEVRAAAEARIARPDSQGAAGPHSAIDPAARLRNDGQGN